VQPYITEEPYKNLSFHPGGFVLMSERSGFNHLYLYDLNGTMRRQLTKGDFVVTDYYGYDGSYNASYVLEDSLTLTHDMADIVVENLKVDNSRFMVTYCLTDIYDNQFWTESVEF